MNKQILIVGILIALGAGCQSVPTANTNVANQNQPVINSVTRGVFDTSTTATQNANSALNQNLAVTNTAVTNSSLFTNTSTNTNTAVASTVSVLPLAQRVSDKASTLSSPVKVKTIDGKEYFMVGQPKGQNSKAIKKIIFSLPGHGSTAEQDYSAWKSQIASHDYALASLNWWHGGGEAPTDYYAPSDVLTQIEDYLIQQGYDADDIVILEGFSRGSANTYAVKSYDRMNGALIIDAVISASGKYQASFPLAPQALATPLLFKRVPWILACGGKDPNPSRDGCDGMNETKTWLTSQGADVLAVLEDPDGDHGAFHKSTRKLASQALDILDAYFQQ